MKIYRLASLQDIFERLNTPEDIRNYISSLSGREQYIAVEFILRSPVNNLSSVEEVIDAERNIAMHEKHSALVYFRDYPELQKWFISRLSQIRYSNPLVFGSNIDTYLPEYAASKANVSAKQGEIRDWYQHERPQNLSHLSIRDVINASNLWHEQMATKGENQEYDPTNPKNILYGPTWEENEENNGWTIQKVTSENDLDVEGNLMNHCVASYWAGVKDGSVVILSLRDPSNIPHVTMETNEGMTEFPQIQGHSNSEPKDEYKAMIKEWVDNKLDHRPEWHENDIVAEKFEGNDSDLETMYEGLNELFTENEYGMLLAPVDDGDVSPFYLIDRITTVAEKTKSHGYRRDGDYDGDVDVMPNAIVNMYLRMEDSDSKFSAGNEHEFKRLFGLEQQCHDILQENYEILDKDWNWEPYMGDYPEEEDFESEEEFEKAIEEWQEQQWQAESDEQHEYMMKYTKFALPTDILNILNKMRDEGTYPPFEVLKEKFEPNPYKNIQIAKIYRL